MSRRKRYPSPREGLVAVDVALSDAQDAIGRYVSNEETKRTHPKAYAVGDWIFYEIENLRRELDRRARGVR